MKALHFISLSGSFGLPYFGLLWVHLLIGKKRKRTASKVGKPKPQATSGTAIFFINRLPKSREGTTHMYGYVWRTEVNLNIIPQVPSTLFIYLFLVVSLG